MAKTAADTDGELLEMEVVLPPCRLLAGDDSRAAEGQQTLEVKAIESCANRALEGLRAASIER